MAQNFRGSLVVHIHVRASFQIFIFILFWGTKWNIALIHVKFCMNQLTFQEAAWGFESCRELLDIPASAVASQAVHTV